MGSLVSIIMPVFNAERFLGEAIQSVLDQTHSNWELLIVNDGSTDGSLQQIYRFKDERICVFSQTNRGVSSARNVALTNMRGDFFCFLDADDILPRNSIESRLRRFDRITCFVDGGVEVFDEGMKVKRNEWRPKIAGNILKNLFRLDSSCFFGLTWLIKRNKQLHYHFDETISHGEDLLFLMSIAHSGGYAFTSETVLQYRRSSSSAMQNELGLARGYTALRGRMRLLFADRLSLFDKMVYDFRVRKIMLLIFLRSGRYKLAIRYLLRGRL